LWGAAALSAAIVLSIVAFLLLEAGPALSTITPSRFFGDGAWLPSGGAELGRFDLTAMVVASLLAALGAVVLAAPIGIAAGLYGAVYAPAGVSPWFRRLLETMAGVPSVIYGLWGLTVLAPKIRGWQPPGQSLLAAMLILALMILPTIALLSESALRGAPRLERLGAAALGLSRWGASRAVLLPHARGGLIAAVLLALGRALGETMAVLMVAGNVVQVPASWFDPVRTLTANIALELGYALELHRSALFVGGLLLLALATLLVALTPRSLQRG
jgi:phosphate transport system permease protein